MLPINGLILRTERDRQVVMNAEDAAELTAALRPGLVIPQHYASTGGPIGDRLFLRSDKGPDLFVKAVHRLAPDVPVAVAETGQLLTVAH